MTTFQQNNIFNTLRISYKPRKRIVQACAQPHRSSRHAPQSVDVHRQNKHTTNAEHNVSQSPLATPTSSESKLEGIVDSTIISSGLKQQRPINNNKAIIHRRHQLAATFAAPLLFTSLPTSQAQATETTPSSEPLIARAPAQNLTFPNYSNPGPFQALKLPKLEHTCTTCDAPADRCRLKIQAWVPKGGLARGLSPPYPLAVITPGFLLSSDQYTSYAERLASWGWCVVTYDNVQQALDPISDVVCVSFLRDLLDWCRTSAPLGSICDSSCVYLIGHSRGGKISVLAAVKDPRVKACFLLDPVDVTVYAPESPEFPSAVSKLRGIAKSGRSLPIAVVGSGRGGDCVPNESNYERFYDATEAPAWEGVLSDAGHLQFLDARGGNAMDLVCAAGKIPDESVAEVAGAMMVAWGDAMVRREQSVGGVGTSKISNNSSAGSSNSSGSTSAKHLTMGIDNDGILVAGVGSFDSLQMMFATEKNARKEVKIRQGHDIEMTTRLKNFEL